LEAGMRIAWVLPDGERQRRFDKFQKSTTHNKFSQFIPAAETKPPIVVLVSPLVKEPNLRLSLEEKGLLKSMNDRSSCVNTNGYMRALLGERKHIYNLIRTCYSDARYLCCVT
jgi:hypothetical protein